MRFVEPQYFLGPIKGVVETSWGSTNATIYKIGRLLTHGVRRAPTGFTTSF